MNLIEPRWMPDGWSARIRIGVVVPHADAGPEAELGAMAPPDVSIHASRLYFSAMRAGGEMDETIPHQPVESFTAEPQLDEAVESLAAAPLNVLALGFTSSAYKHGPDGERELVRRLGKRARGMPIVTTCLAAEAALAKLGARRIALVNPAWFDSDLDRLGARYFEKQGFTVVHHAPTGLPSGQKYVTPSTLYDWIARVVADHSVDAVFAAGNGQRAVGVIAAAEEELGISMITANQVILWDALRQTGQDIPIKGYGRLFN